MTSQSPARPSAFMWLTTVMAVGHLAFVTAAGRLRWEHAVVDLLVVGLAWIGPRTRRFLRGGFPLWLSGMLMDSQGLWLGWRGDIHTGDLFALDGRVFPAPAGAANWPAYLAERSHVVLDLLCGFGYATYLFEVFAVVIIFFVAKHPRFEQLCWSFLVVNVVGVATYMLYPAAPPWYVLTHGLGPADLAVAPSAAGAARFDAFFGIQYFHNFYSRNQNVFGAMPSLHSAYPVLVLWHTWHRGPLWRVGAGLFSALIAFSAVYLSHHYVLDVTAGMTAALLACMAVELAFARQLAPVPVPVPLTPGGDTRA
ncbi:inositol phosphorylceramide synthase [Myxococcaceae bacterium JPH2]|nr:inositol phosphorylceramide synthase [Myxococcaceae bacterium JPH2]